MKIGVVVGSSRPGRIGDRVRRFVVSKAELICGAEFVALDLADYAMPFFDEAVAPLSNRDRVPSPPVRRWLDDMSAADGSVFLTPEYNYGPPAVLKNALDFVAYEGEGKPVSILSYSTTAHGGTHAGQQLQLTLSKLRMLPLPKCLPLAHADRLLNEAGELIEKSALAHRVAEFIPVSLGELVNYASALKALRRPPSPAT